MCELFEEDTYCDSVINKLKSIKKIGKYKYPSYADDEVNANLSVAFIVNQLPKMIPNWKTNNVFKCSNLLKKYGSNISKMTTEDKLILRKGYFELKYPNIFNNTVVEENTDASNNLKDICDKIRKGAADGILSNNDFALKIAFTLSKSGYTKCSDKQLNVLNIALNKIDKAKVKNARVEEVNRIISDANANKDNEETSSSEEIFSIANMSNLLGKGLMGDGTI